MRLAQLDGCAQHFVVGDKEGHLNQQWQAATHRIYTVLPVELAHFLLHFLFARVAHAVLLVFFLDRLHLRLELLHSQSRFHLVNTEGQQQDGNDEGLNNNRPTPVVNEAVEPPQSDVGPGEQWTSQGAEPAEVYKFPQIFFGADDRGDGDGINDVESLGANKETRTRITGLANGDPENICRFYFIRLFRIGHEVDRFMQSYHGEVLDLLRNKHCSEIRTTRAHPVIRAVERVAAGNLTGGDVLGVGVDLILDLPGAIGGQAVLVAEACRPRGERVHGRVVLEDGSLHLNHVAVVKLKCLAHRETGGGIFKLKFGGRAEHSRGRDHI